jgi:hypothetical protein
MSRLEFDEHAAKRIEAMYLIGDAVRRRKIVREALRASPGERILDVGCGPGQAQGWEAGQRELGSRGEFSFAITQFCLTALKTT